MQNKKEKWKTLSSSSSSVAAVLSHSIRLTRRQPHHFSKLPPSAVFKLQQTTSSIAGEHSCHQTSSNRSFRRRCSHEGEVLWVVNLHRHQPSVRCRELPSPFSRRIFRCRCLGKFCGGSWLVCLLIDALGLVVDLLMILEVGFKALEDISALLT